MKTAISIPDKTFQLAEILVKEQGTTRSQLYTQAIDDYLIKNDQVRITEKLNEVYANIDSKIDPILVAAQAKSVFKEDW